MNVNKIKLLCVAACFLIAACVHNKDKQVDDNAVKAKTTETANIPSKDESFKQLSQTSDPNILIAQDWQIEEDLPSLKDAGDENGLRLTFRGLYLSADNTFVKNPRGSIEFGTWSYDDPGKKLTLKYDAGRSETYVVKSLRQGELVISGAITGNEPEKYVADRLQYKNAADNPFYAANNKWRIHPAKSETDEAIRKRLKDCIHFFVLFYRDCINRDINPVSFYGFPNCLKFYGPGIFIKKKDELDNKFIDCFYNDAQAMKAYDLVDAALNKKYTWPKENIGWLKKNAIVLEQVYNNL